MLSKIKTYLSWLGGLLLAGGAIVLAIFLGKKVKRDKALPAIDEREWMAKKLAEMEYEGEERRVHDQVRLIRAKGKEKADEIAQSGSFADNVNRDIAGRGDS